MKQTDFKALLLRFKEGGLYYNEHLSDVFGSENKISPQGRE